MKAHIEVYLRNRGYDQFVPKVAFFDMDGVLFNSMPYHAQAWHETMTKHGITFSLEDAYINEGRTGLATIQEFFLQQKGVLAPEDEIKEIYRQKSERFNELSVVKPIEGVYDLLKSLKKAGVDIYIVTGSAQLSLIDTLNTHFEGIFSADKMVTAFDVKKGKPDPEPYLMALAKSGVKPSEGFVVENAPLGVRSAVAAGLFTIAVNTGPLDDELLAKECADSGMLLHNMRQVKEQLSQIIDFNN